MYVRTYRKPGYFANIYRKILFLAYDNAQDCFSGTARRILFSVSNTGTWLSVTRGVCNIYLPTCKHGGTSLHQGWCRLYSVYTRNMFFFPLFFFTRATRRRRNSKCVSRLFQWTTLLSEMYMRKTVKVGNIIQCVHAVTCMQLSWRFYSRTWNLPTQ